MPSGTTFGRPLHSLTRLVATLSLAACASSSSTGGHMSAAPAPAASKAAAPGSTDPRVGLKAGVTDAGQAAWNLKLVSNTPQPDKFAGATNSDIAFTGNYVIQGNYNGLQIWDVSDPAKPVLKTGYVCPASQNDVSIYKNLLIMSAEANNGRLDCGAGGVHDSVSTDRIRGVRIFDVSDITNPKYIGNVQTCRGSHTHTVVLDPKDTTNIYIYISGQAPVRSPTELAGCVKQDPDSNPNSSRFRIEVIKVPLAAPQTAAIVSSPRIFDSLTAPAKHGESPQDVAEAAQRAKDFRAKGGYTATVQGLEYTLPPQFVNPMLDSVVKARNGTGAATAADSTALRGALQGIVDKLVGANNASNKGPDQCHDITVYPSIGLAGGACAGYGLLLDIRDPAHPKRLAAVSDSNFSYWHSATFNNDGTKLLFSDEWGGGGMPKCRATDKHEWGADAIFTVDNNKLTFKSYYKMPAPQTQNENCVAHNGSLIPIPGRDVMVQAWYQGGVSVFDWTDAAHPKEIAFFDRGPMDSTKMVGAGFWSAYWYNGSIYGSEIARGFDVFELTPSAFISQNEIDAAKTVHLTYFNVQDQPKFTWPASYALAGAYLDQLERSGGLAAARVSTVRKALADAQKASGQARKDALTQLSASLHADMAGSSDGAKVHTLANAVGDLANAQ